MNPIEAYGYFLTGANEPLEKRNFTIDGVNGDDVVVKVAGCGLCHTDLGFISGNVKTNAELPLVLGHEISGTVIASGPTYQNVVGKNVIIPAVLPCGKCELCQDGRSNICRLQKMPGNDFNGGFASHIKVPGTFLCHLPDDLGKFKLSQLSVIADAVTTPYQSLMRSQLKSGNLAIVIGIGGIGIYMAQLAKEAGATVIALDIDDQKLAKAREFGIDFTINSKELSDRDIKNNIRTLVKENNLSKFQWKVFETSGTGAGQNAAFSLLSFAGTVGIIGFTMQKVEVRLSNIMAFDADLFGNWGCKPEYYPTVVEKVLQEKINLLSNIEEQPLDTINEYVKLAFEHKLINRIILMP